MKIILRYQTWGKMVHFVHIQFSFGLKSLISSVFIFLWSLPVLVQPFFSLEFSRKSTISFQSEQFSAKITYNLALFHIRR